MSDTTMSGGMQPNPVAERQNSMKIAEEISGSILQTASELSVQTGEIKVGLAWDFMNGMPVLDLDASAVSSQQWDM